MLNSYFLHKKQDISYQVLPLGNYSGLSVIFSVQIRRKCAFNQLDEITMRWPETRFMFKPQESNQFTR